MLQTPATAAGRSYWPPSCYITTHDNTWLISISIASKEKRVLTSSARTSEAFNPNQSLIFLALRTSFVEPTAQNRCCCVVECRTIRSPQRRRQLHRCWANHPVQPHRHPPQCRPDQPQQHQQKRRRRKVSQSLPPFHHQHLMDVM